MVSPLFYYPLALLALYLALHPVASHLAQANATPTTAPATPITPTRKRFTASKPFAGTRPSPQAALDATRSAALSRPTVATAASACKQPASLMSWERRKVCP